MVHEIRLLPMGKVEFESYDLVIEFLNNNLRNGKGKYYFRRRSIVYKDDILTLFQYGGRVIASAVMINQSNDGKIEAGVDYKGCYVFDMTTMKIFENPIKVEQIREYIPEFKGFNQATQKLDKRCISLFE